MHKMKAMESRFLTRIPDYVRNEDEMDDNDPAFIRQTLNDDDLSYWDEEVYRMSDDEPVIGFPSGIYM